MRKQKYHKNGKDKGSQRFKCRGCERSFTEYTGTWLDGLHKKSLVVEYIELMMEGKSLMIYQKALHINKKTALDWRHKILSSLGQDLGDEMKGIVESDETFFEESGKGNRHLTRRGRKRGWSSSLFQKKTRGVSSAVIATADRSGSMNLCIATMGRIGKEDFMRSIEKPLPAHSILCTDGHVSYKGFLDQCKNSVGKSISLLKSHDLSRINITKRLVELF